MSEVSIAGLVRVETEASVWLIEPDRYLRLPKVERPRRQLAACLDNALTDAQWMAHRGVHEHHDPFGLECRLRILPAWRPGNSNGIVTGPIVAMTPWLLTCHGPSERASGAGAEPSTSPQDDRGAR
jgi:hypothetical protein